MAQRLADKDAAYDVCRGATLTALGTVWNGPFLHVYLNTMEAVFPAAHGARSVVGKISATQLVANPLMYLPVFFAWTGFMYGLSLEETEAKAKREYVDSLLMTWAVFTPVNAVAFRFVPVPHQAAVFMVAGFVHSTWLSLLAGGRT